jgi:hypothetical protein
MDVRLELPSESISIEFQYFDGVGMEIREGGGEDDDWTRSSCVTAVEEGIDL